eukprot:9475674-Pyramimonas_sp.AAC.1
MENMKSIPLFVRLLIMGVPVQGEPSGTAERKSERKRDRASEKTRGSPRLRRRRSRHGWKIDAVRAQLRKITDVHIRGIRQNQ